MTIEDEQESQKNSQFKVVWHTPLVVDPVQASEELSNTEGAASVVGGSRMESDPSRADANSTSLAKREC